MNGLEFEQEHWDSACDNMPQDYLEAVVAQMMPKVKPPLSELNRIEMRLRERKQREAEEAERRWHEHYYLAEIRLNPDGSNSEVWLPRAKK